MAQDSSRPKGAPTVLDSLSGEMTCGVCLELFDTPVLLPCGHNFCRKCVASIINSGSEHLSFSFISIGPPNSFSCPLCQSSINLRKYGIQELPINKALESIVSVFKNHSPVDIFDYAWNTDTKGEILQCTEHKLPADRYCESCCEMACRQCEKEKHGGQKARHKIGGLVQKASDHQSEIASLLTNIKKSDVQLNDRIQLLEDIISGIETNEEHVTNQLDQHVNGLMAAVRQQREELKRRLSNDIANIRTPISEELKKCKALKTNIQELMRKLATVHRTRDLGLRIKLMKDCQRQLQRLLCYDIPWCVQSQEIPEVSMPTWELSTMATLREIEKLGWRHHASEKQSTISQPTQTVPDMYGDYSPQMTPGKGQDVEVTVQGHDDSPSGEKTFDEPDGDIPTHSGKHELPNNHAPAVNIVTPEHDKSEVTERDNSTKAAQQLLGLVENQSEVLENQTGAASADKTSHCSLKETSLDLGEKAEAQSVPSLDLTSSPLAEKFKKRGEHKPATAVSLSSPAKAANSSLVHSLPSHHADRTKDKPTKMSTSLDYSLPSQNAERTKDKPTKASMSLDYSLPLPNTDRKKDKPSKTSTSSMDYHLPSQQAEKANDKPKKKSKDRSSSSKKSSKDLFERGEKTSPRTTSEALASFVARRRTVSPASSPGRSLDVWFGPDGSYENGEREEKFRSSKSDTKLSALSGTDPQLLQADMYGRDWKHSGQARTRSFSPSRVTPASKSKPMMFQQSPPDSRVDVGTNSEHSPNSYSKQPISVNLDFGSDPVIAQGQSEVSSSKVKGHVTHVTQI